MTFKPQGDPYLAEMFAEHGVQPEPSRITGTDMLATAINREQLGKNKRNRIVDLECGHKAVTTNKDSMTCPRCVMLIRHGFDYDGFRNLGTVRDEMIWREDPCRHFNEPTDLAGNFINDDLDER